MSVNRVKPPDTRQAMYGRGQYDHKGIFSASYVDNIYISIDRVRPQDGRLSTQGLINDGSRKQKADSRATNLQILPSMAIPIGFDTEAQSDGAIGKATRLGWFRQCRSPPTRPFVYGRNYYGRFESKRQCTRISHRRTVPKSDRRRARPPSTPVYCRPASKSTLR
ncbi:hypothetical protein LZ32DRAFT_96148 [Colletotrichum eremochloae]|nr:hypothetical protein LZ32DRAFT_96148 [Colletotrichum eremochloae]